MEAIKSILATTDSAPIAFVPKKVKYIHKYKQQETNSTTNKNNTQLHSFSQIPLLFYALITLYKSLLTLIEQFIGGPAMHLLCTNIHTPIYIIVLDIC